MARVQLELSDWIRRGPEFESLLEYDDGGRLLVAMEYRPPETSPADYWKPLQELWLDLPRHSHLLDALDRDDAGRLLLRYAALEWEHPGIRLYANARAREIVAE